MPDERHAALRLTVEPLSATGAAEWQAYVARHPQGTLFHDLAWKQAVETAFSHRPIYLSARRGAAVAGVLPMFLIATRLSGRTLVSVPYGVYGGPLADDAEARRALLRAALHAARELRAARVELRCGPQGAPDPPPDPAWTAIDDYVTFRRRLPTSPDAVPEMFPRKARAAARRARERHALSMEWESARLADVWKLYARSMRRLASLNYPRLFFEALVAAAPDRCLVQLARLGCRPVAGLVTLRFARTAMPYFVGVDERAGVYGLNNLLYECCMQHAVQTGCEVFDFGRSRRDNRGSVGFKRSFGFEPAPLPYLSASVGDGGAAARLTPSHPRVRLARRVWPWLPLAVTRPLGAWLSRSIPG